MCAEHSRKQPAKRWQSKAFEKALLCELGIPFKARPFPGQSLGDSCNRLVYFLYLSMVVGVRSACVSKIGTDRIIAEFDEWSKKENSPRRVRLQSLPPNLALLKPIRAFKNEDGLFLVLKERFVDETGIFIEKEKSPRQGKDSDPSFVELGPRVYRYRVKG